MIVIYFTVKRGLSRIAGLLVNADRIILGVCYFKGMMRYEFG